MKKMDAGKRVARIRALRAGGYSTFAAAVVVLIAIGVNLAVGTLPTTYTQLDFTEQSLYTLSDQTRRIVRALDSPVTLTLLATEGQEDAQIQALLNRYADLSDQVAVTTLDPAVNPGVLKEYEDQDLYMNSVIVSGEERSRLVSYEDIYLYNYSMDYSTYGYTYTVDFDGERALTSAIHYVSSDDLPKVYVLTGHGESQLPDSFTQSMESDNLEVEELSLLSLEQVPEDADCLVINAPQSDLSQEEAQMLISYLDEGGRVMLFTDYIASGTMENLLSVTAHMGLTVGQGLIVEGDGSMSLRGYAYYLLPGLNSHDITQPLIDGGYYALVPLAQPMEETGESEAQVTFLMTTSDQAYAKAAGYDMETTEREEGDLSGPFYVGAASQLDQARLVWFTSAGLLDDSLNSLVSGGNHNLALGAMNWMCEQTENIAIHAKSLDSPVLTLTAAQSTLYSIVLVALVPAALLIAGLTIWFGRKRR